MKMHFLPSVQSGRVATTRKSLKALGILVGCLCLAEILSAFYIVQNPYVSPAPILVSDADNSQTNAIALSPHWALSVGAASSGRLNIGSWNGRTQKVKTAAIRGTQLTLHTFTGSPDQGLLNMQVPESGQQVTILGVSDWSGIITGNDSEGFRVDGLPSSSDGKVLQVVGDKQSFLGILVSGPDGVVVVGTNDLLKAFPELSQ